MFYFGEVRVYVGGRMELYARGEEFIAVWIPGKMIAKSRYHNKGERKKIIEKAKEVFGEIEIGIIPDFIGEEEEEE